MDSRTNPLYGGEDDVIMGGAHTIEDGASKEKDLKEAHDKLENLKILDGPLTRSKRKKLEAYTRGKMELLLAKSIHEDEQSSRVINEFQVFV